MKVLGKLSPVEEELIQKVTSLEIKLMLKNVFIEQMRSQLIDRFAEDSVIITIIDNELNKEI